MQGTIVCGGIALDDITLPDAKLFNEVGGSAVYASLAASLFSPTILGGISGVDFPSNIIKQLSQRGIDTSFMQRSKKPTFRWKGKYSSDLSEITVVDQQNNAYEDFKLDGLIKAASKCRTAFLSNIDPQIQLDLITRLPAGVIKLMDSMDLWIVAKRDILLKVLKHVDVYFIGLREAQLLVEEDLPQFEMVNKIMSYGPKVLVLKKGEHGLVVYGSMGTLAVPSYPLTHAIDPSGAGDCLGGAVAGILARLGKFDRKSLSTAVVLGSVVSSFVVEGLATQTIMSLTLQEVINRAHIYLRQIPSESLLSIDRIGDV